MLLCSVQMITRMISIFLCFIVLFAVPSLSVCSSEQAAFAVSITPDSNPEEVTWQLFQLQGVRFNETRENATSASFCISNGDFLFNIGDAGGDGLCCDFGSGSYEMSINEDQILNGSDFGDNQFILFEIKDGLYVDPDATTNFVFSVTADCSPEQMEVNIDIRNGSSTAENKWILSLYDAETDSVSQLNTGSASAALCLDPTNDLYLLTFQADDGEDFCCGAKYTFGINRVYAAQGRSADTYPITFTAATLAPTLAPTEAPVVGDLGCLATERQVFLDFSSDISDPLQFSWDIKRANGVEPVLLRDSGVTAGICLSEGFYVVSIRDSGNDGFTQGSIILTVDGRSIFNVNRDTFTSFVSFPFEIQFFAPTAAPVSSPTQFCDDISACESTCSSLLTTLSSCSGSTCICNAAASLLDTIGGTCKSTITSRMTELGVPSSSLTSSFEADNTYTSTASAWTVAMQSILLTDYSSCISATGPDALCLYYKSKASSACDALDFVDSCDMVVNFNGNTALQYFWPYCFPSSCVGSENAIYGADSVFFTVAETCVLETTGSVTFSAYYDANEVPMLVSSAGVVLMSTVAVILLGLSI